MYAATMSAVLPSLRGASTAAFALRSACTHARPVYWKLKIHARELHMPPQGAEANKHECFRDQGLHTREPRPLACDVQRCAPVERRVVEEPAVIAQQHLNDLGLALARCDPQAAVAG